MVGSYADPLAEAVVMSEELLNVVGGLMFSLFLLEGVVRVVAWWRGRTTDGSGPPST